MKPDHTTHTTPPPTMQRAPISWLAMGAALLFGFGGMLLLVSLAYVQDLAALQKTPEAVWLFICGTPTQDPLLFPLLIASGGGGAADGWVSAGGGALPSPRQMRQRKSNERRGSGTGRCICQCRSLTPLCKKSFPTLSSDTGARHSAVHGHGCSMHIGRLVACEKQDRRCNIFRLSYTTLGDTLQEKFSFFFITEDISG